MLYSDSGKYHPFVKIHSLSMPWWQGLEVIISITNIFLTSKHNNSGLYTYMMLWCMIDILYSKTRHQTSSIDIPKWCVLSAKYFVFYYFLYQPTINTEWNALSLSTWTGSDWRKQMTTASNKAIIKPAL